MKDLYTKIGIKRWLGTKETIDQDLSYNNLHAFKVALYNIKNDNNDTEIDFIVNNRSSNRGNGLFATNKIRLNEEDLKYFENKYMPIYNKEVNDIDLRNIKRLESSLIETKSKLDKLKTKYNLK